MICQNQIIQKMQWGYLNIVEVIYAEEDIGSDRASSKGYIVRWVEAPSNKLLTIAFEASLGCVTVM